MEQSINEQKRKSKNQENNKGSEDLRRINSFRGRVGEDAVGDDVMQVRLDWFCEGCSEGDFADGDKLSEIVFQPVVSNNSL